MPIYQYPQDPIDPNLRKESLGFQQPIAADIHGGGGKPNPHMGIPEPHFSPFSQYRNVEKTYNKEYEYDRDYPIHGNAALGNGP